MPKLTDAVKSVKTGPVWQGPEGEGPQGGVTQSMLGKFLECRERFRVRYVEGWRAEDQFSKYIEYGNMWHICEEELAAEKKPSQVDPSWKFHLRGYCLELSKKYPLQVMDIDHWRRTCEAQFPVYVEYWAKHKDVEQRTPLLQEQVFDIPYELPSGRTVRLRGKFDSVDLVGKAKSAGIYLKENKTKGDVDRADLERQLQFDLQTMLYLSVLERVQPKSDESWFLEFYKAVASNPIRGVCYNVVRRPFSGGKGSIKRREPSKSNPAGETKDEFYRRLSEDYFKTEPEYWFQRWRSEVSPEDIARFRKECLDPILETMCWWYDCQTNKYFTQGRNQLHNPPDFHWRHPFGVMNSVDAGYTSDVDGYINTGSTVGLRKVENLFTELQL